MAMPITIGVCLQPRFHCVSVRCVDRLTQHAACVDLNIKGPSLESRFLDSTEQQQYVHSDVNVL